MSEKMFFLRFSLQSDATFGRGDGVAGLVDDEVQHDEYGCPYLGGRALKGLLVAECSGIMDVLARAGLDRAWEDSARRLYGRPGSSSGSDESSLLHISDARLPEDLRLAIARDCARGKLQKEEILNSLTAIRRQTAIDPLTGAAREHTLRSRRVVVRGTVFESALIFAEKPAEKDLALLAACVKAFRRAGTGCQRGLGRLRAELLDEAKKAITDHYFDIFRQEVLGCKS
jgi:CRISPR/Cas system CSM-associated protein Csm3 (group 7 of RAMP superfamily)